MFSLGKFFRFVNRLFNLLERKRHVFLCYFRIESGKNITLLIYMADNSMKTWSYIMTLICSNELMRMLMRVNINTQYKIYDCVITFKNFYWLISYTKCLIIKLNTFSNVYRYLCNVHCFSIWLKPAGDWVRLQSRRICIYFVKGPMTSKYKCIPA